MNTHRIAKNRPATAPINGDAAVLSDATCLNRAEELLQISNSASSLLEFDTTEEILDFLMKTLTELSGADYIILFDYSRDTQSAKINQNKGLDPFIDKLSQLLAQPFQSLSIPIKNMEDDAAGFQKKEIHLLPAGVHDLVNGQFPLSTCKTIEKLLGLEKVYLRGFVWKNKLYGGVSLGYKKGKDIPNLTVLETLINQGALALGRKYYQDSLLESKNKYRLLVNSLGEGIASIDPERKFVFVNPAAEDIFGVGRGELVGKSLNDFLDPRELSRNSAELKKRQQGETSRYELLIIRPDGQLRDLLVTASPMLDNNGQFQGSFIAFLDNTERKHSEQELARQFMLDAAVAEISTAMLDPDADIKTVAENVLHHARLLTHSDYGLVTSIDPETGDNIEQTLPQKMDADFLLNGADRRIAFQRGKDSRYAGLWGHALNTRQPFFTNDPASHPETNAAPNGHLKFENYLACPAVSGQRLLGLIALANASGGYSPQHLEMIHQLGEIYSLFLRQWFMKEELANSEARYSSFINSTSDMAFIKDDKMRYMIINAPMADFFGKSSEQIIGHTDFDLLPEAAAENCFKSDSLALEKDMIIVSEETHGGRIFETTKFPVRLKNSKAIGGMIRDITVRRQAEQQILKLSKGIEQSPAVVIITDALGIIEYVNPKFTEVTGYTQEEALGQNPRFLKSETKTAAEYQELWETITSGKEWHGQFLNKKKSGELFWESALIAPVKDDRGIITQFVAVKQDITAHKQMEDELIAAKEKAEENDRLKSAFLQNIFHEIRTPLNGILGFTELLVDPQSAESDRREYAAHISQSAERLLFIITNIVSISTIEAGQERTLESETDINQVLHEVYSQTKSKTGLNAIALSLCNMLKPGQNKVMADQTKLVQVLGNLANNAVKFTSKGKVELGCAYREGFLEFYVRDTGIGIAEEMQQLIFERFRQGDNSTTREYEGAGLGLAISKAHVELWGGRIWVESKPGMGSIFYFTLPFKPAPGKNAEASRTPIQQKIAAKPKTVLVAEDAEANYLVIKEYLAEMKVKILQVKSSAEMVDYCFLNPAVDLVIMNISLPAMDGFKAMRSIKEMRPNLPVIAQSGHPPNGERERALQAGFSDFIAKPIEKSMFLEMVRRYL